MAPSPDPPPTAPASDEAPAASRRGYAGASWAKFNETVIPLLLVGVLSGLMLFHFNETSDRITRLEERIDARFAAVDSRFAAVDSRLANLEESQREIAQTLARLVALFEAHHEAERSQAPSPQRSHR